MYIDMVKKEINLKLVYYGAGLGGKTTNLRWLYEHAPSDQTGEMVSLATEVDRTLFFDFMPLEAGTVGGFKVRLHLYTVPGQVFYEATRQLVVKGADGVMLVADSQSVRMDANVESLQGLKQHLQSHGLDLKSLPYVVQCNKRDLPNVASIAEMRAELNFKDEPFVEASAASGEGVMESLKKLGQLVIRDLREHDKLARALASPNAPQPSNAQSTVR